MSANPNGVPSRTRNAGVRRFDPARRFRTKNASVAVAACPDREHNLLADARNSFEGRSRKAPLCRAGTFGFSCGSALDRPNRHGGVYRPTQRPKASPQRARIAPSDRESGPPISTGSPHPTPPPVEKLTICARVFGGSPECAASIHPEAKFSWNKICFHLIAMRWLQALRRAM